MRIQPTNPFHISRAYQTSPPKPAATKDVAGSIKPAQPTSRMVAAQVPGRVNFSGTEPQPTGPTLPFYRHPADKNAAATAINAGRSLDIQA
jgi:hypothetical protein